MGLRGVMRVCSASKVTNRIILTRRALQAVFPQSAGAALARVDGQAGVRRAELGKPDRSIRVRFSIVHPTVISLCDATVIQLPTTATYWIMAISSIEDVDKFNAVVSQEEARLRQLHPTPEDIPGCMSAFDNFLSCNSTRLPLISLSLSVCSQRNEIVLGNQLKSIYRFGEMAHCGAKWNEFKFCMSIKGLHPEQRRDAWIRHRAEWWARRRVGPSSENVWERRAYVLHFDIYRGCHSQNAPKCKKRTVEGLPATFAFTRRHGDSRRLSLIGGEFTALLVNRRTSSCLRVHPKHWNQNEHPPSNTIHLPQVDCGALSHDRMSIRISCSCVAR